MLKKLAGVIAAMVLVAACAFSQVPGQASEQTAPKPAPQAIKTHLKVGDKAPDFTLTGVDGKVVKLSKLKGKNSVVMAFYPKAFTGG